MYEPTIDHFVEQLRSVVAQTFTDWTCVIMFDSPASAVLAHHDVSRILEDPRFQWRQNPSRLGAAKNFEVAIKAAAAESDAVACCDQDDRWYPEKLATLARALAEAGPLSLVHSDLALFDETGPLRGTAWRAERRNVDNVAPWQLLLRNVVTGCSMMLDADLARRYAEIPAESRLHDRWFGLAAACHGGVRPVRRPLLAYRLHDAQHTGLAPYRGFLAATRGHRGSRGALLRECVRVWRNAREFARVAAESGMPIPSRDMALYARPDLGLALALTAASHFGRDPVLAGAAGAAAVGKLVSALARGRATALPEQSAIPPPS